ncbi:hypothetical protein C2845_PM16G04010 [Panicum miliaceum]|uniref:DUF4220 domain-containing protein n=1 Tax=Panicum miliaceum TaxID=4540 RepID=A0A3L6PZT7_PANMI|nr:hypothetical protein C2845_PM16G04010 [Panicum miliaceum]
MESLIKLFNELEIQLLVLLSFTLQLFLFFAGNLRRSSSNSLLRLSLWAAYLGADLAAVYALGYLSRHEQTQQLAFFWAPFLLIHLGGQDTITAFAMEDNNLWLRHLLNLVTQVNLALYVFWKSIGRHNVELLISSIFAFVAGIIKYGERTWSLKCGSLTNLEISDAYHYRKRLPEGIGSDAGFVRAALQSMPSVINVLSERSLLDVPTDLVDTIDDCDQMIGMVRLQLGMIYDDLYTKALELRTRNGVILRCISQASVIIAFGLFYASDKERYKKADIAITYSLFVGCFFLELCSMFIPMMSPWTWAWLKVQKCDALAKLSWFIFCCDTGYPKIKQRWPNLIGQYNLHSWLTDSDLQPKTYSKRIMILFRKLFVDFFGVGKKEIFWLSKILDIEYVDVDSMIVEFVGKEVRLLLYEFPIDQPQEWRHIGLLLKNIQKGFVRDFGQGIIAMHHATETFLRKYAASHSDMEANATRAEVPSGLMDVCRKLSKYMIYLLVTQPSILPLSISAAATLDQFQEPKVLGEITGIVDELCQLDPSKETLEELARMWTRLLLYAAGKSRAAMHAVQLSRGGELITFAWLLMAHCAMGDSHVRRIELTNTDTTLARDVRLRKTYAFLVPQDED